MEDLKNHLEAAAQAVEAELSKFDHLQVVQQKLAELKQLIAELEAPAAPAEPADPNAQPQG
jgi:hypothetical protein